MSDEKKFYKIDNSEKTLKASVEERIQEVNEVENDVTIIEKDINAYEVENQFIVTSSPHVFSNSTTRKIMLDVLIALLPATIVSVIFFGIPALILVLACTLSAVLFEWGFQKICKRPNTIGDLSAAVTGLLLALNLSTAVPWWQGVIGSLIAIVVVKGLFGGLGKNFANPAITARIIMLLAFGATVTASAHPIIGDVVSGATPLPLIKEGSDKLPSLLNMFLGINGGAIGETSALALLIGGLYLIIKRVISWHTPVVYIATVFLLTLLVGKDVEFALYHILAGGLFIGAFFMATDYATTPSRPWGKVIFAFGCGLITVAIRLWGNYPEGVSFSILFMNLLTPYIEKWVQKRPFGGAR